MDHETLSGVGRLEAGPAPRTRTSRGAPTPTTVSALGFGGQLINCLLVDGDAAAFRVLERQDFVNDERPLYDAVRAHLEQHGSLPAVETMNQRHALALRERMPEATPYYLDLVRKRAVHNAIQGGHGPLMDAIRSQDIGAALRALTDMKDAADAAEARRTQAADPGTVARILNDFGAYDAGTLTDEDSEDAPHVVHDVIGPGLTLLASEPKAGKSWLVMDCSIAVQSGAAALGSLPVSQGPVLHLALEDTRAKFRERIELMGLAYPAGMVVAHRWDRFDQGGLAKLEAVVASMRPAMVVIDTTRPVMPSADDRKQLQQQDYDAVRGLKLLADKYHIAVVAVLHTRKVKAGSAVARVAGSHGLTGAADNVVVLDRVENSGTLNVTGRNIGEHKHHVSRDPTTMRWSLTGPDVARELCETDERALGVVSRRGRATPNEVAEALGINRRTASHALARLARDGRLFATGRTRDRAYAYPMSEFMRPGSPWYVAPAE